MPCLLLPSKARYVFQVSTSHHVQKTLYRFLWIAEGGVYTMDKAVLLPAAYLLQTHTFCENSFFSSTIFEVNITFFLSLFDLLFFFD